MRDIKGNGETSRDFCYIENCVQANLLAAMTDNDAALGRIFNVAFGELTTLNQLFALFQNALIGQGTGRVNRMPVYREFRPGHVRHSLADISKAEGLLGYRPSFSVSDGVKATAGWHQARTKPTATGSG